MSAPVSTSPEQTVNALFAALDALDTDAIEAMCTADVQGVDELSGGWRRGRDAMHEYLEMVKGAGLSDARSGMSDLNVTEWGDASLVTFLLDQTYRIGGEDQSVHAPTTIALRREDGAWRVCLVHSVPMAEEQPA
jgi:ketosteroid isomerase-like protein